MRGILGFLLRVVFLGIIAVEIYYFYLWFLQPIIPVIQTVLSGDDLASISYSGDIAHPIDISIAGMDAKSAINIVTNTLIRLSVFTLIFAITKKIFSLIATIFR